MQNKNEISPWSVYDKNFLQMEYSTKTDRILNKMSKKQLQEKQTIRFRFKGNKQILEEDFALGKHQRRFIEDKNDHNRKIREYFEKNRQNVNESDYVLPHQSNLLRKNYDHRRHSKRSQSQIRSPQLENMHSNSILLQQECRNVNQLLQKCLLLKMIKKKLNQQINPLYDNADYEQDSSVKFSQQKQLHVKHINTNPTIQPSQKEKSLTIDLKYQQLPKESSFFSTNHNQELLSSKNYQDLFMDGQRRNYQLEAVDNRIKTESPVIVKNSFHDEMKKYSRLNKFQKNNPHYGRSEFIRGKSHQRNTFF